MSHLVGFQFTTQLTRNLGTVRPLALQNRPLLLQQ